MANVKRGKRAGRSFKEKVCTHTRDLLPFPTIGLVGAQQNQGAKGITRAYGVAADFTEQAILGGGGARRHVRGFSAVYLADLVLVPAPTRREPRAGRDALPASALVIEWKRVRPGRCCGSAALHAPAHAPSAALCPPRRPRLL